jgi:hypothetical protein
VEIDYLLLYPVVVHVENLVVEAAMVHVVVEILREVVVWWS